MEDIANSKVALIDEDGLVITMGKLGDGVFHVDYLYEFIKEEYCDEPMVKMLEEEFRQNFYAFYLGQYNYVVFCNNIHDGFEYGMFYFPDNINSKQIQTIKGLNLDNKDIAICYDLENFGSFVHFKIIGSDGGYSLGEAMDEYFLKNNSKKGFHGR